MAVSLVTLSSCKKDTPEPDLAEKVVSTYVGDFQSSTFQSVGYKVTVTKVNNTKIKITPEDNHGTTLEVGITETSGTYAGSTNGFVITFQEVNGVMTLNYANTTAGSTEQFSGTKQ